MVGTHSARPMFFTFPRYTATRALQGVPGLLEEELSLLELLHQYRPDLSGHSLPHQSPRRVLQKYRVKARGFTFFIAFSSLVEFLQIFAVLEGVVVNLVLFSAQFRYLEYRMTHFGQRKGKQ